MPIQLGKTEAGEMPYFPCQILTKAADWLAHTISQTETYHTYGEVNRRLTKRFL
jgi:hypothetical protein